MTTPHQPPACPTDGGALHLCGHEQGLLASVVRSAIRRTEKTNRQGQAKFGDRWDGQSKAERLDILHDLYRRLGKDPTAITSEEER